MVGGGPPGAADRCRLDQSASGATGAHDCQPWITRPARDQGQERKKSTSLLSWWVRNVNDVATPKFPPPPPRQAQYRSLCWEESQVTTDPSARTTCAAFRLSLVSPKARPTTPTPPPSVSPAMPTVAHEPPGTASPRAASFR